MSLGINHLPSPHKHDVALMWQGHKDAKNPPGKDHISPFKVAGKYASINVIIPRMVLTWQTCGRFTKPPSLVRFGDQNPARGFVHVLEYDIPMLIQALLHQR